MNIKLKEISRDDLKVGDTVGIARTVNCGWLSTFRHRKIIPVKITRITPKRTKIETDIYEEHGKGEKFYEYDENARKENELLAEAMVVENILHRKSYRKISKERYIPMNPKDFYGYRRKTVAVLYERMRLLGVWEDENNE